MVCIVAGMPETFAGEAWEPIRTPWGKPDFNGFWDIGSLTPLERPEAFADKTHFTPQEARDFVANHDRYAGEQAEEADGEEFVGLELWLEFGKNVEADLRTSRVVDPPDGRIPEGTPAAQAKWDARDLERSQYAGPQALEAGDRCISGENPPLFSGPSNNYLHIFQTRQHIAILTEFINDARIIPLDGRPHIPERVRQWKGDSRAVWEGDVLVVESSRFRNDYGIGGAGRNMRINERFSLTKQGTLRYEFTIDDPKTFVSSWTVLTDLRRTDNVIYEYACHEANYSMEGILRGARFIEANSKNQ